MLPIARHPFVCRECQRQINDISNYRRHLAVVHRKKIDGTDADEATVVRYSRYMQRGPRSQNQSTATVQPTSREGTDEPRPSTSAASAAPTKRMAKPKDKSRSTVIPPTDVLPTAPPFNVADDLLLSSSDTDDSADDFFVEVTDEEATERKPDLETKASPTTRKPTRPLPVVVPRRRVARLEVTATATRPSTSSALPAKRRRLEMAPSVLAQRVIAQPTRSSRDIVDDLASRYGWTPVEQRDRINVVRGMRAMAAAFSARIRRQLPINRTDADVQQFLTVMEEECRTMEGHVSDEFAG